MKITQKLLRNKGNQRNSLRRQLVLSCHNKRQNCDLSKE